MMDNIRFNTKREVEEDVDTLEDISMGGMSELIVYNDDHNTFDWVIECLVKVCDHSAEQAEQLSLIIHYKGKACVKIAPFDILKPKKDALSERGLSVVIEHSDSEV